MLTGRMPERQFKEVKVGTRNAKRSGGGRTKRQTPPPKPLASFLFSPIVRKILSGGELQRNSGR